MTTNTPEQVLAWYDAPGINSVRCHADGNQILAEALRRALKERDEWRFKWMNEVNTLERANLEAKLKIAEDALNLFAQEHNGGLWCVDNCSCSGRTAREALAKIKETR